MTKPKQHWRPIALMPAFKYAVGSAAENAFVQAQNMRLAMDQHEAINRVELARVRVVFQDTALYIDMCKEQSQRWRSETLTTEQVISLNQLDVIVDQWDEDTKAILDAVNVLLQNA